MSARLIRLILLLSILMLAASEPATADQVHSGQSGLIALTGAAVGGLFLLGLILYAVRAPRDKEDKVPQWLERMLVGRTSPGAAKKDSEANSERQDRKRHDGRR